MLESRPFMLTAVRVLRPTRNTRRKNADAERGYMEKLQQISTSSFFRGHGHTDTERGHGDMETRPYPCPITQSNECTAILSIQVKISTDQRSSLTTDASSLTESLKHLFHFLRIIIQ